jgi:hypothetical protein
MLRPEESPRWWPGAMRNLKIFGVISYEKSITIATKLQQDPPLFSLLDYSGGRPL